MVIIAKIFGRKVILAPHCSVFALLPDHSPKIWKKWVKFITNQCDYLLVLSKEWFKFSPLLPLNNLIYLPNAINTREYLSIDRELSEKSKPTNILFLGHISVEKGLLDLVDAISILTQDNILNFSVDLIGEPINHQEFEEIMQKIDVKKIANYINTREPEFGQNKIERLKLADIFVLPSHHEGMPMTILEAMASGLPVVATSVGGIPDLIINGKNGFLVPPSSPTKLSDALKEMIQNPSLRFQIGKENREKAKQSFDIEKYVEKLGAVYLALANG
jgi:glycosyltransferase involved in cell wall biosynthesis